VSCQRCCQPKYRLNSEKTGAGVILVSVFTSLCQDAIQNTICRCKVF